MIDLDLVYSMVLLPTFPRMMGILCANPSGTQISGRNDMMAYLTSERLKYLVRCAFRFIEEVLREENVVLPTVPHLFLWWGGKRFVARLMVQLVFMPPVELHPGCTRVVRSLRDVVPTSARSYVGASRPDPTYLQGYFLPELYHIQLIPVLSGPVLQEAYQEDDVLIRKRDTFPRRTPIQSSGRCW